MRKSIAVLLVLCALLAVGTAAVWAAGENQDAGLAPTGVSLVPEVPYPGQVVQYTLDYTATTGLSAGPVTYTIEVQGQEDSLKEKSIVIPDRGMEAGAQGGRADVIRAAVASGSGGSRANRSRGRAKIRQPRAASARA